VDNNLENKKSIAALILICVALAAGLAVAYLDLKTDIDSLNKNITSLKGDNANLASEVEQLRSLFEQSHVNQTISLPAVTIYNQTKYSVVFITNDRLDGTIAEGTGFVYDSQGDVITNNHVIEDAANISVTFFDGNTTAAQVIGTPDVYSDLALIKVDNLPEESHPLIIRNSTQLLVGEPVYAIGNPFGLSRSLTSGIVSQLGRVLKLSDLGVPPPEGDYSIADVIQTDAAINPGNSGGPLLDGSGFVIGVTFAIETGNSNTTGFIGIGYAVPSVLLLRVIPALKSTGHYYHPYVGIMYDSRYTGGVLLENVTSLGPADKAGLKKDDVIKEVDGVQMNRGDDLIIYLERYKSPGGTILLNITRSNSPINNLSLTLGTR
jgi:S1-C subfamily serine protease